MSKMDTWPVPVVPGLRLLPGAACTIVDGRLVPLLRGGDGTDDDDKSGDPKASGDQPADGKTPDKDGDEFDKARAMSTIQRLRQTEKDLKRQLSELKPLADAAKEAADKDKTDSQKLQERLQAVESELTAAKESATTTTIRLEVERAARKLDFIDEDDAFRLIDRDAIEFEDGKPKNVAELLGALAKSKPHLVKKSEATTDDKPGDDQKPAGKGPDPTPKPATNGKTGEPSEDEQKRRREAMRQLYR